MLVLWFVWWFGLFWVLLFSLFSLLEHTEFQTLAKDDCAHRTHGVSTRAKKVHLDELCELFTIEEGSVGCILQRR